MYTYSGNEHGTRENTSKYFNPALGSTLAITKGDSVVTVFCLRENYQRVLYFYVNSRSKRILN